MKNEFSAETNVLVFLTTVALSVDTKISTFNKADLLHPGYQILGVWWNLACFG